MFPIKVLGITGKTKRSLTPIQMLCAEDLFNNVYMFYVRLYRSRLQDSECLTLEEDKDRLSRNVG